MLLAVYKYMKKMTHESQYQLFAFGLFGSLAFPIHYFTNHLSTVPHFDSLLLTAFATSLCVLLAGHKFWPSFLKPLLPIHWYVTLVLVLPGYFTYMLLMDNISTTWLLISVAALFLLMLLADWLSFFIILVLGVMAGLILFHVTANHQIYIDVSSAYNPYDIIGTYTVSIIMGLIFLQNKRRAMKDRLDAMWMLAGNVAHDLRTPLAGIKMANEFLRRYTPVLVQHYNNTLSQVDKELGL